MSEERWQTDYPHAQGFVHQLIGTPVTRTKAGRRKLRLFACECCRLIWPHITDPRLRSAVEVAERYADGQASAEEFADAGMVKELRTGSDAVNQKGIQAAIVLDMVAATTDQRPLEAAFRMTCWEPPLAGYYGDERRANGFICDVFLDIFGDPPCAVTFPRSWRTGAAVAIARQMYESRDFSAMAILADALQDAGCDGDDILTHRRDPKQVHVRGCWVVDLVLGKA